LTAAVGVPRLVGIECPFGQVMGKPGDRAAQREVLWRVLEAVEEMTEPGSVKHLALEWRGMEEEAEAHPPGPPRSWGTLTGIPGNCRGCCRGIRRARVRW
jgi:hypothetical protein